MPILRKIAAPLTLSNGDFGPGTRNGSGTAGAAATAPATQGIPATAAATPDLASAIGGGNSGRGGAEEKRPGNPIDYHGRILLGRSVIGPRATRSS